MERSGKWKGDVQAMEDGESFRTGRERRQTSRTQLRRAALLTHSGALCAHALVFRQKGARFVVCIRHLCRWTDLRLI